VGLGQFNNRLPTAAAAGVDTDAEPAADDLQQNQQDRYAAKEALQLRLLLAGEKADGAEGKDNEAHYAEQDVPPGRLLLACLGVGLLVGKPRGVLTVVILLALLAGFAVVIRRFPIIPLIGVALIGGILSDGLVDIALTALDFGGIPQWPEVRENRQEKPDAEKPRRHVGDGFDFLENLASPWPGAFLALSAAVIIITPTAASALVILIATAATIFIVALAATTAVGIVGIALITGAIVFGGVFLWSRSGVLAFAAETILRNNQRRPALLAGDAAANIFLGDGVHRTAFGTSVIHRILGSRKTEDGMRL
jgi:hypothetical protein